MGAEKQSVAWRQGKQDAETGKQFAVRPKMSRAAMDEYARDYVEAVGDFAGPPWLSDAVRRQNAEERKRPALAYLASVGEVGNGHS